MFKTVILTAIITGSAVFAYIYQAALPHMLPWISSDYVITLDDFKAADAGSPAAITKVGDLYYSVQKYPEAARFYQQAVQKDHADAMVKLSKMYKNGIGVPQDTQRANELLVKASVGGNLDAIKSLGNEVQGVFENLMK